MESKEFFWADKVADDVLKRNKKEFVCQGMWTPSGFFHIGNARSELFTPYAVYRVLKDRGLKVRQNFIIDDFDGIRKIPEGLGIKEKDYPNYLEKPCYLAPSPVEGYKSWADFFVSEAVSSFESFGLEVNIISAYESYKAGKFDDIIRFSLENSKKIVDVWKRVAGASKEENFVPLQIVCSKCNGLLSTQIVSWDSNDEKVLYKCKCGNEDSVEPYRGNAKLHWRVHWVAHWIVHEVDFESGGKDHFSKGGSVDVGRALMREVFRKEPPIQFPTEFILLYGRKISGSKGNVISLKQWNEVALPEVFRFMNFSYKPQSSIEFSLSDNNFILLMERYERAERLYYGLEKEDKERLETKLERAYYFSQIKKQRDKINFQLPYSFAVQLCQLIDYKNDFNKIVSVLKQTGHIFGELTQEDKDLIFEILQRANNWLVNYAPESYKISFVDVPDKSKLNLDEKTKEAIKEISDLMENCNNADEVQTLIYEIAKKHSLELQKVFKLIYLSIIGKEKGPKAGTLIMAIGKEKVSDRLRSLL
ncbi:MAG: lysine--tRNA ligase [Candidatus Diapherotrites archaeon]|nr:lysine--tRNA ligase [Candidatus Diapherotrites archaeon]